MSRKPADPVVQGFRLLGMTYREAKLYLALMNVSRTARDAAQSAGLHRATGYRVLERLLDRGMIVGDGRKPQQFRSVEPSIFFHRLELFYRDETEIPSFLAEVFGQRPGLSTHHPLRFDGAVELPRILAAEGRAPHPALVELSQARQSVSAIIRPLSTTVAYRSALARTLGRLARNGVHVRLLTDAMPADFRFCRAVVRETGAGPTPLQMRHYSPLASNLYAIDRQKVLRLPALGVSNRTSPVAVAIDDPARVRPLVNRFESLWSEARATALELRVSPTVVAEFARSNSSAVGTS